MTPSSPCPVGTVSCGQGAPRPRAARSLLSPIARVTMKTADVDQWDETICDMAACPHPQCWDTLRRVEQGRPRIRARDLDPLCRASVESEDELPTLKIINLPSICSSQNVTRCSTRNRTTTFSALETFFSYGSLQGTSAHDSSERDSLVSSERLHFPGLNSATESHAILHRQMNLTYLNRVGKLQVIDLGELAAPTQTSWPDGGNLIVKWIPNIHRKSQRPVVHTQTELKPLRRLCVKNLPSENLLSLKEVQSKGRGFDTKRKKSWETPTGNQPYLLNPKRCQIMNRSSKKTKPAPKYRGESSTATEGKPRAPQIKKGNAVPRHLQTATIVQLQDRRALLPMNRTEPEAKQKHNPVMVKQKVLERMRNKLYLRKPLKNETRLDCMVLWPLLPKLEQQPHCQGPSELPCQSVDSHPPASTEETSANKTLSHKTSAERECHEVKSLTEQLMGLGKRRSSVKPVQCKSSTTNLVLEGVEENRHLLTEKASEHEMYCNHPAIRMEAMQALGSHQGEGREQPGGTALPPHPPPPSPSPLLSKDNEEPSGAESPLCIRGGIQGLVSDEGSLPD
ncbi:uncharacterized protein C9orf43 homolog isoform X1 [Alligator mississippiensis]|uniref:uncharacterized protein C9orf43 homolog isoform X1 n=2 Tax=Alligator mississippiensis TaxID=8496 RepID=UPI000711A7F3|nr:uncharacterized protein C9orf43 homolog isoform X1 [Alligator mississippiensis]